MDRNSEREQTEEDAHQDALLPRPGVRPAERDDGGQQGEEQDHQQRGSDESQWPWSSGGHVTNIQDATSQVKAALAGCGIGVADIGGAEPRRFARPAPLEVMLC